MTEKPKSLENIDTAMPKLRPVTIEKWYKPICHHCPYFVDMCDRIDMFGIGLGIRCERPDRFKCLGLNPGIQRAAMFDYLQMMVAKRAAMNVTGDHEVSVDEIMKDLKGNSLKKNALIDVRRVNFNGAKRYRGIYRRKKR